MNHIIETEFTDVNYNKKMDGESKGQTNENMCQNSQNILSQIPKYDITNS